MICLSLSQQYLKQNVFYHVLFPLPNVAKLLSDGNHSAKCDGCSPDDAAKKHYGECELRARMRRPF